MLPLKKLWKFSGQKKMMYYLINIILLFSWSRGGKGMGGGGGGGE